MNGWIGDPVTNVPNTNPGYLNPHPGPGSMGFGMDPNPAFTAAINRLAAAIEKFNERK